jgi:nucleoside-diphosphate-sugar epimerase
MQAVVLRPPLVYGPEVGANFRALLRLVGSGLPLPLGSVANRRSLIARDNLVDAILGALNGPTGVFFVGDGPALSTPALIRALASALGRPARLIPFPPALLKAAAWALGRADAADSLLGSLEVDDAAFRAAFGWRAPVAQDAAFAAVAAWFTGLHAGGA